MWVGKAVELRFDNNVAWTKLPELLNKEYGLSLTYDQVRDKLRNHPRYKQSQEITPQSISNDSLLEALKKECEIESLCSKFSVDRRVLQAYIDVLKDNGYNIVDVNGAIKLFNDIVPTENKHTRAWNGDRIIRFGALSDPHYCNIHQQLTFNNYLYDTFEREGINTVYISGDMFDGWYKNRPEHIFELIPGCIGADDQVDYVSKNHPKRKGITTEFIIGNHCYTHIRNGGINVGIALAKQRDDMIYLGSHNAIIELTPNCKLELNHPLDGSAYAISYSLQKYIDSMSGGDKPNILLNGHHHKWMSIFLSQCPCI